MNIQNIDCFEFLKQLPDKSVDFVCIDPPYGILTGHKIETEINIELLFSELHRVLKDNSFVAFFGLMPTLLDWCNNASKLFRYKEHIVWSKRMITSPYLPVQRSHESLMLYAKGKPKYYETEARYEDLKTPALHVGIYELSTIKTTISDLYRRLADKKYDDLYYLGLPTANGSQNGKNNDDIHSTPKGVKSKENLIDALMKNKKNDYANSNKRNYDLTAKQYTKEFCKSNDADWYGKKYINKVEIDTKNYNDDMTKDFPGSKNSFRHRSKRYNNITNNWSFLPQNQTKFGEEGENHKHPTVKPILFLERIIKLCLPAPTADYKPVVLDCFLGTGTTAIACENLGYDFVGCELDTTYFKNFESRLQKQKQQNERKLF